VFDDKAKFPTSVPNPVSDKEPFVIMLAQLGHKKAKARMLVNKAIEEGHWTGSDEAFAKYLCSLRVR